MYLTLNQKYSEDPAVKLMHRFTLQFQSYFYSLAKYEPAHRTRYIVMTIVVPILAHGVYDVLAFSISLSPVLDGFLNLLLALLCFVLWKWASRSIQKHLERG